MLNRTNCHHWRYAFAFATCFVLLSCILLSTAATAYCDDTDDTLGKFTTATDTITDTIYNIFRAAVCPLCIVALCIASFQFLAGGNRGSEMAFKIVKACIIAIFLVAFAPTIIKIVANTVIKEAGSDDNPLNDA